MPSELKTVFQSKIYKGWDPHVWITSTYMMPKLIKQLVVHKVKDIFHSLSSDSGLGNGFTILHKT